MVIINCINDKLYFSSTEEDLQALLVQLQNSSSCLSIESLSALPVSKSHLYEHIKNMCGHCPVKIEGTCCRLWLELVCIHTEYTRQKYRPDRNAIPGIFCDVKMHHSPGTTPAKWPKCLSVSVLLKPCWISCITLHVIYLPAVALEQCRSHALTECLALEPEENRLK